MDDPKIRFCPHCGHALERKRKSGALRPVCPACKYVHFYDPKVAAAVLVEDGGGRVLLVRRIMQPRQGLWTVPGGFVDRGEDPAGAAVRECREETGLQVTITRLLDLVAGSEHEQGADFVLFYGAHIQGGALRAGDDADRVGWFGPGELPPIAFDATRVMLERWQG